MTDGPHCCAPLCSSNSVRTASVSFHAFPDIKTSLGKQWLYVVRRKLGNNFSVNRHTKVCSQHFTEQDFRPSSKGAQRRRTVRAPKRRLAPGAVLSLFSFAPVTSRSKACRLLTRRCDNQAAGEPGKCTENDDATVAEHSLVDDDTADVNAAAQTDIVSDELEVDDADIQSVLTPNDTNDIQSVVTPNDANDLSQVVGCKESRDQVYDRNIFQVVEEECSALRSQCIAAE